MCKGLDEITDKNLRGVGRIVFLQGCAWLACGFKPPFPKMKQVQKQEIFRNRDESATTGRCRGYFPPCTGVLCLVLKIYALRKSPTQLTLGVKARFDVSLWICRDTRPKQREIIIVDFHPVKPATKNKLITHYSFCGIICGFNQRHCHPAYTSTRPLMTPASPDGVKSYWCVDWEIWRASDNVASNQRREAIVRP